MIHRASALGGCLKGQIAAALGMKPIPHSEDSLTRMGEGQLHEDDVIARLTADGYTVTRQQEEVNLAFPLIEDGILPVDPAIRVQGHLDGVLNGDPFTPPGPKVLEVKSMSDAAYKEFQSKGWHHDWPAGSLIDKYRWQLSVYMLATGLEGLLVTKNRNSGAMTQHGIETPYYSLDQITERVAYIEDHVARGQLPDDCPHDWFCPYKYLCQQEVQHGTIDKDEFLPDGVIEYWDLTQRVNVLEAQKKLLRPVVEAFLGDRQAVIANGYKVQTITQNVKEKIVPASTRTMLKVTKLEEESDD